VKLFALLPIFLCYEVNGFQTRVVVDISFLKVDDNIERVIGKIKKLV